MIDTVYRNEWMYLHRIVITFFSSSFLCRFLLLYLRIYIHTYCTIRHEMKGKSKRAKKSLQRVLYVQKIELAMEKKSKLFFPSFKNKKNMLCFSFFLFYSLKYFQFFRLFLYTKPWESFFLYFFTSFFTLSLHRR